MNESDKVEKNLALKEQLTSEQIEKKYEFAKELYDSFKEISKKEAISSKNSKKETSKQSDGKHLTGMQKIRTVLFGRASNLNSNPAESTMTEILRTFGLTQEAGISRNAGQNIKASNLDQNGAKLTEKRVTQMAHYIETFESNHPKKLTKQDKQIGEVIKLGAEIFEKMNKGDFESAEQDRANLKTMTEALQKSKQSKSKLAKLADKVKSIGKGKQDSKPPKEVEAKDKNSELAAQKDGRKKPSLASEIKKKIGIGR